MVYLMTSDTRYMLDTNTVSYLIKEKAGQVRQRLQSISPSRVCISSITHAELLYGLAKKPEATALAERAFILLSQLNIETWSCAQHYAQLRVDCSRAGKSLGAMDMLIAAHAKALDTTLVTSDKAFHNLGELLVVDDWAK